MSGKAITFVVALAIFSLALVVADLRQDQAADAETAAGMVKGTYTVTVEIESLRVISYLDENGVEHPADSLLVAPVPIRGPREITVGADRRAAVQAPFAGRVGSR